MEKNQNLIDLQEPSSLRWEHIEKKRYYQIILSCDLFGDWVVTKVWGGVNLPSGRITHVAYSSLEEAKKLIEKITSLRIKKGYIPRPLAIFPEKTLV